MKSDIKTGKLVKGTATLKHNKLNYNIQNRTT